MNLPIKSLLRLALSLLLLLSLYGSPALRAETGSIGGGLGFSDQMLSDILPAGRSAIRIEGRQGYADQLLAANGDKLPLFSPANNIALDSRIIPALAIFQGATLGTTHVKAKASGQRERIVVGYGLTPDITIGLLLAWGQLDNRVDFSVSGATVASNTNFNPAAPVGLFNLPFLPLGYGPTVTTEDIQRLLTNPAFGYGYKRAGSVHNSDQLDPVIGMRWRISQGDNYSTILSPSYRFGMAEKRDPDQLFDMRISEGVSDFMLGLEHNVNLSQHVDLLLAGLYTMRMEDTIKARARSSNELIVPLSRTERLNRRLGDILEMAVELGYTEANWRYSLRADRTIKNSDHYHSPLGQDVSGLETNSDMRSVTAWLAASWSGVQAYQAGKLPLPLLFSVQYRHAISGQNDILTRDFFLTLTTVF